MLSKFEKPLCSLIALILEKLKSEDDVYDSEILREALNLLESLITLELRKKYSEWEYESVDGIFVSNVSSTGENQISIAGMCVLISDQSLVPIFVKIKIADSRDKIDWIDCNLAESGENGVIKIPYNSNLWKKQLHTLDVRKTKWHYSVFYGKANY